MFGATFVKLQPSDFVQFQSELKIVGEAARAPVSHGGRRQCSHIDLHTHAVSAFDNRVILTFDLSTSGSTHAERLPFTACVPSLVLIAQAVFFISSADACRHTDKQTEKVTDVTDRPIHSSATVTAGVSR